MNPVWCMTEFRQAHAHATGNGRNKFMIPILYGETNTRDLFKDVDFTDEEIKLTELKLYLETHTYIDCKSLVNCHYLILMLLNIYFKML